MSRHCFSEDSEAVAHENEALKIVPLLDGLSSSSAELHNER